MLTMLKLGRCVSPEGEMEWRNGRIPFMVPPRSRCDAVKSSLDLVRFKWVASCAVF